jgi:hypothetical protein
LNSNGDAAKLAWGNSTFSGWLVADGESQIQATNPTAIDNKMTERTGWLFEAVMAVSFLRKFCVYERSVTTSNVCPIARID